MSDDTTPGLRDLILAVLDRVPEQRTGRLIDELADALQPELDRRDAEIEQLQDLTSRLRADYRAEIAEAETQIRTAEAERDQALTAWWSARIGRATFRERAIRLGLLRDEAGAERDRLDVRLDEIGRAFIKANRLHPISEDGNLCTTCKRPYPCPTVTALSSINDHASEVIAERDQLKLSAEAETRAANRWMAEANQAEATIARVKALAKDMRTWCSPHGIAVTYAQRIDEAIEPPERDHDALLIGSASEAEFAAIICATMRKHRAEVHPEHAEGCGNCAVIKGAPEVLTYGLDSSDLPAVREFAANLDPRQEG